GRLALVVAAHAVGRLAQRLALLHRQAVERGAQLRMRQFELRHARHVEAVEAARVFDHRRVTRGAHGGEDVGDGVVDTRVGTALEGQQRVEFGEETRLAGIHAADDHAFSLLPMAPAKASSIGWMRSCLSFSEAWLTTRRELMSRMCSTSTSPLARSVPPVDTRSTMASASPTSGASSIEPYSLMRSTCTPFSAKCALALSMYLVATRIRPPGRDAVS